MDDSRTEVILMVASGSFSHFVCSDSTLSCKRIESTHHGISNAVLRNVVRLLVIFIKFDEFFIYFNIFRLFHKTFPTRRMRDSLV